MDPSEPNADVALPVHSEGRLPGGHHWTLILEVNDRGQFAHLMVAFASGGACSTGAGRAYDDGQVTDGPATMSLDHLRAFTWAVRPDVGSVELLPALTSGAPKLGAPAPAVPAELIHDDPVMRVFLAVIDDGHAAFHAARALGADGTVMATQDITDIQAEFTAGLRWSQAMRRGGTREAGPRPRPRVAHCPITQHVPDHGSAGPI